MAYLYYPFSCVEDEVKVVDVYTRPYKNTQMIIKMNVNFTDEGVNIAFLISNLSVLVLGGWSSGRYCKS